MEEKEETGIRNCLKYTLLMITDRGMVIYDECGREMEDRRR